MHVNLLEAFQEFVPAFPVQHPLADVDHVEGVPKLANPAPFLQEKIDEGGVGVTKKTVVGRVGLLRLLQEGLSARFLVVGLVVPRVLAPVQVEPSAVFLHLLHGQGGFLGGFILVHNVGRVFAQLFQPFPRHGHGALLDRSVHTLGILF